MLGANIGLVGVLRRIEWTWGENEMGEGRREAERTAYKPRKEGK